MSQIPLATTLVLNLLAGLLLLMVDGGPMFRGGAPGTHLVIIVPGTYSSDDFWTKAIPGKVTFASELVEALGPEAHLHPELWSSSVFHQNREEAADRLARTIDKLGPQYRRISLVGHSHGGNIAMLAAERCQSPLDTIVCLGTPHAYLRTVGDHGQRFALPIYCSPRARQNTRNIISLVAASDAVPHVWSTELFIGLRENKAIDLTEGWRADLQQPRLADDGLIARLFESSNIVSSRELSVADRNLLLASLDDDPIGLRAHSQIHSRRLGKLIGDLLRKRAGAADALTTTVIPADADDGEPVEPAVHHAWLAQHQAELVNAGWVLERAAVSLASTRSADVNGSLPDPVLRIRAATLRKPCLETQPSLNSLQLECATPAFIPAGSAWSIEVLDDDPPGAKLMGDYCWELGSVQYTAGTAPPAVIAADGKSGRLWSGNFVWRAAHY